MLKIKNSFKQDKYNNYINLIPQVDYIKKKIEKWMYIYELHSVLNLLYISKKSVNYYFNVPINFQRTRSRKPKNHPIIWKIKYYKFITKYKQLFKVKVSTNFLLFDFINKLWYKQWPLEWKKIRNKRIELKRLSYKKRTNINFPILQYKHIIRNFKIVNKKKQKFLRHFNLGFYFFEYIKEGFGKKRFNKNVLKKKYSKFFILKKPFTKK